MADGTVGVREPPSVGYQVDNASRTNDAGTTVQRVRVEDPELMEELRQIRDALAKLAQCVVPPPPGFAGGPQMRITTMPPSGVSPTTALVVANNTFGSLSQVTTIRALERVDFVPGLSGVGAGFPAVSMLDSLSQLLSVRVGVS